MGSIHPVSIVALAALSAPAGPTVAGRSATRPAEALPRIFAENTEYDFGEVWAGRKIRHEFTIKNIGNADLIIKDVRTDCGCTASTDWPRRLAPGRSGPVAVIFNTATEEGAVNKGIYIYSNDPFHRRLKLLIAGTVRRIVQVDPPVVMFGQARHDEERQKTVKIVNRIEEPLLFESVESNSPRFTAVLVTVKPGREYRLVVTAVPPYGRLGSQGMIRLTPSRGTHRHKPIIVKTHIYVPPRLSFTRRIIVAGDYDLPRTRNIFIRYNGRGSLHITDVAVTNPAIQAQPQPVIEGKSYRVEVIIPPGTRLGDDDQVIIHTDHREYPTIEVPIERETSPRRLPGPPAYRGP